MDIHTFIKEMLLLLKENIKKIAILTGAAVLLFLAVQGASLFFNRGGGSTAEEDSDFQTAYFDIYIEQDDIGTFLNSYLIEEIMKREFVIGQIEEETQIAIVPVLEEYALENEATFTNDDPINVDRNTSSHIMHITFDIGSSEENLTVAEAYYNWFETTDFSFFDNKDVYYLAQPALVTDEDLQTASSGSFSLTTFAVRFVFAVFAGLVLGVLVSFISALFSKTIQYGFTYGWDENDIFLNYTGSKDAKAIVNSMLRSEYNQIAIISEFPLSETILEEIKNPEYAGKQLRIYADIAEMDVSEKVQEFILVVERKKTTKEWYQNQRKQLKAFRHTAVKIIQN